MQHKMNKLLLIAGLSTLFLSGCQVVSVKNQALNVSIANERDSILSRNKLSEASLNVLSMTGREAKVCSEDPENCINEIKQIPQIQDEQLLSTASELYLAKAIALEKSSECKIGILSKHTSEEHQKTQKDNFNKCLDQQLLMLDKSVRYSYAYMFNTKRAPQARIFDNRQVQLRDFYNQSIAKLVSTYNLRYTPTEIANQIKIGQNTYNIDFSHYPELKDRKIEQLCRPITLTFLVCALSRAVTVSVQSFWWYYPKTLLTL